MNAKFYILIILTLIVLAVGVLYLLNQNNQTQSYEIIKYTPKIDLYSNLDNQSQIYYKNNLTDSYHEVNNADIIWSK